MSSRLSYAIAGLVAALLAGPVTAATFSETDLGDFANFADETLFLDLGLNSVSGSIDCVRNNDFGGVSGVSACSGQNGGAATDDSDAFFIDIPDLTEVTALTLTVTNFASSAGGTNLIYIPAGAQGVFSPVASGFGNTTDEVVPLSNGAPGDGTDFRISVPSAVAQSVSTSTSFDWTLNFTVASVFSPAVVPLPAGFPLLALALGGLAFLRRRTG
ncbi:MAG: VPLPA-CTERM sorting domain-containing protein [Pseudomonadota bacterium]